MPRRRNLRAWIGVFAAYVIALQAFLTAVVATEMAVAPSDPFAICWNGADNGDPEHRPAGPTHASHQACIVCSFASIAALPPSSTAVAPEHIEGGIFAWRTLPAPIDLARQRSPQVPQGPPQIA
jgi:hypothetical protein